MPLFLLFLAVPIIEIALFIQVGGWIGLFPTLAIVVLTAVLGTWMIRTQGLREMANLRTSFGELRDPTEPLAHGAMILVAGALLLTPGFFTDAVGFALLVPGVRLAVFRWARTKVKVASFATHGQAQRPPHGASDIIDGEYTEVPENQQEIRGPSGWTKH